MRRVEGPLSDGVADVFEGCCSCSRVEVADDLREDAVLSLDDVWLFIAAAASRLGDTSLALLPLLLLLFVLCFICLSLLTWSVADDLLVIA